MRRGAGAEAAAALPGRRRRGPDPALIDPGPEERIAARRRRIAARLDAKCRIKRAAPVSLLMELRFLDMRCVLSLSQRLAKLLFDGTQLVTNIQVAVDSRETQRRAEEAELKLQR
uniref:Uncharacterized protein n=1 Tax=Apteryx owenii TaxID=8824 RepID=A0A8B9QIK8_APTOW